MVTQLGTTIRDDRMDRVRSRIDPAISSLPTNLLIYSGAAPANADAANANPVLATVPMLNPAFVDNGDGSMSKNGNWNDLAVDASGTATHFRIVADGIPRVQGTVGTAGADMIVDTVNLIAGQAFSVMTFTITEMNP